MKKLLIVFLTFLSIPFISFSQEALWNFRYEYVKSNPQEVDVFMDITIPKDFHMYSFDQAAGGPIAAEVKFNTPTGISKIGTIQSLSKVREYFDDVFNITTKIFRAQ